MAVVLAVLGTTVLLGRIPSAPGGTGRAPASPSGSPSVTARTLTGKDPETAGCGGAHARTAASAWVGGTYLEMRYSADCGTVWARVSAAAPGDTVSVTTGDATRRRRIGADAAAYTRMLTVRAPDRAKACVTLATGVHGCTPPGR